MNIDIFNAGVVLRDVPAGYPVNDAVRSERNVLDRFFNSEAVEDGQITDVEDMEAGSQAAISRYEIYIRWRINYDFTFIKLIYFNKSIP